MRYCLFTISTSLTTCNRFIARQTRDYVYVDWWSVSWLGIAAVRWLLWSLPNQHTHIYTCVQSANIANSMRTRTFFIQHFSLAFRCFLTAWIIIYLMHNCAYIKTQYDYYMCGVDDSMCVTSCCLASLGFDSSLQLYTEFGCLVVLCWSWNSRKLWWKWVLNNRMIQTRLPSACRLFKILRNFRSAHFYDDDWCW